MSARTAVRRGWTLSIGAATLLAATGVAQDEPEGLIANSSNLSSALPPGEWSRVETAVDKGLKWLAEVQKEDGRMPGRPSAQPAITSFAVMAFLSRGHMPDQGRYGRHISRAIDFVLSTQRRRGYFSLMPVTPPAEHLNPSQTVHYNHSIAGLMLAEVYGMTIGERSKRIEVALKKALVYHREVQLRTKQVASDEGGWRYGYPDSPNASSDMSVTGWALMFLRSARTAEFNVQQLYYDQGLDFVERCYVDDPAEQEHGVFRYRPLESQPDNPPNATLANTSSAMLTLILGGRQDHPGIADGARWLRSRPYPRVGSGYYYLSSYYSSQAVAQVGGETWNEVFPQIVRGMLLVQADSGSWPLGGSTERKFGPAYSTSLAILALTPAYQLLPIYQR